MKNNSVEKDQLKKQIGINIRKAIDVSPYNQSQISDLTGIANSTLSNIINGISMPESDKLLKLSKVLKKTVDYFLTGKEPEKYRINELKEFINKNVILDEVSSSGNNLSNEEKELIEDVRNIDFPGLAKALKNFANLLFRKDKPTFEELSYLMK